MADNLRSLEERIDTDIDPNGTPGSIFAENHNAIEKEILRKAGKYSGSPFLATKQATVFVPGTLSLNGNALNVLTNFNVTASKLTSDLIDFGKTLATLEIGDLIQFKDYSGRAFLLEFQSYVSNTDGSGNPIFDITVKGVLENTNYIYQDNETSASILSVIKKIKPLQKSLTSIVTDDGTASATTPDDTFNFEGGNGAIVSASGKTITITPKVQTIAETPNLQDELDLKASKAYADSLVVGLIDDRGNYDASTNTFPTTGGSGTSGAVLKGDLWYISAPGTLGGQDVGIGDSFRALTDAPGQTATNWDILESNIGYVPENNANKSTSVFADYLSDIKFPTVKSVYDFCMSAFRKKFLSFGDITGTTHTFGAGSENVMFKFSNNSAITATIPTNATTPIDIGSVFETIPTGNGILTVQGAVGVTILTNLTSPSVKNEVRRYTKIDTNTWTIEGNNSGGSSEISIRNASDVEQFKITDLIRFENVSFDSANKKIGIDPLLPLSAYLDFNNGSDTTGVIENAKKPFKTIQALLTALPATGGETYTIYIYSGNVSFTRKMARRNLRFISYVDTTLIFDTVKEADGITNAGFLFSDAGGTDRTWTFENSNISFSSSRSIRFGREFNTGVVFKGNINNLTWVGGEIYVQQNSNIKINNVTSFGGFFNGVGNGSDKLPSYIEIDYFNVTANANIIGSYKGTLRINNLVKTNIGTSNDIDFSIPNSGTNDITLEFKNITHNGLITTYVNKVNFIDCVVNNLATFYFGKINGYSQGIVTGNLIGTNFNDNGYFGNGTYFKNFTGRIGGCTLANGVYTFDNCNITTNTTLTNRWGSATLKEAVFFKGYNTITQLVTGGGLIGSEAETTVEFGGTVRTNANNFGSRVKSVYVNSTFKEKLFEVVIRSKNDLVGRILDSNTTYIIDGNIVLLSGEFINIPASGLTLIGYGFNVSIITKNVSGESIFASPVGGSGDFISNNVQLNSGIGSVFNLTDSNGSHALEINDVNFQSCASLGLIKGYRQFTGTTVGIYGCSDGLILDGSWNGFKLTNTNAFGFGASGTLIKKGATTSFANRLYLDLNLSLPTGAKICDFQESNFASDKLLQIVNCLVKVNSIIDPATTASTFPNITPFSPKAYFTNNIGLKNSFNEPYGLKTTNLFTYADDASASSGGIQVGEVYVESTTGYFKTRLT